MRIKELRFSVPFCIFEDQLEDKAFRLVVYLFSKTDFNGACSPGYRDMKHGAAIGSDSTLAITLRTLQSRGWIFHIKKGGSNNATIWMQIPPRFRRQKPRKLLSPVLQPVEF